MKKKIINKFLAFIVKVKQRGIEYFNSTLTYFLRRNWYIIRVKYFKNNLLYKYVEHHFLNRVKLRDNKNTKEYFQKRKKPIFHFDSTDISNIVKSIPESLKKEIINNAEDILKLKFNFRNIEKHTFSNTIDWNFSPNQNVTWMWDLNRHFYFITLAKAFYFTSNKKYIQKLTDLWCHWIDKNKPGYSKNWFNPFEVAARLNNWIWCFHLLLYSDEINTLMIRKIITSLYDHADYLFSNLELNWPNNHLILEVKALLEFSIIFPEIDNKKKFFDRAYKIFEDQVKRQILNDGCHSELNSMYHLIVAGELYEIFLLAEKNNIKFRYLTESSIINIKEFSRSLVREDGSIPLIGDSAIDDNYIRFGIIKNQKKGLNYWISDKKAFKSNHKIYNDSNLSLKCFHQSGFAFIKERTTNRNVHIIFDFGDFTKNPVTDHAHCDALSFELWANGNKLIIDPGVFFDNENKNYWYQFFRSTKAHNTLMVDDFEQTQLWQNSSVLSTANINLLKTYVNKQQIGIEAICRPYRSKKEKKIFHKRRFEYNSYKGILISDTVEGTGKHNLKWFFHFAPGIRITNSFGLLRAFNDNSKELFSICCEKNDGPQLQISKGRNRPIHGWSSLTSFQVEPIISLTYSIDIQLPYECKFRIEIK
jgi:hypothetical protein